MPASANKRLVILAYVTLALGILLVFWQVRNFDFVNYDDDLYVYENPNVSNGLSSGTFITAFTTPHVGNWLPLTWLSFALDCQLFGLDPGRMHLVNVLLHLANALLLFALLRKMTGALWPSAFVAAAFALHPMHVESVAWITERKDVLSTFFLLLTLAAYIGYVRRRGVGLYALTLLLFALGLLAKPMLVTLPLLLLLLDYWPLGRFDSPGTVKSASQGRLSSPAHDGRRILYRAIIEKIPFFAFSVASSLVTFFAQRSSGSVPDLNFLPLHSRLANAFLSWAEYIGMMFWPRNLAVLYRFDPGAIQFWRVMACASLVVVISVLVIRLGRKQKYLLTGWLWFLVALLPVIGLIQSGGQSMADRYTYVPYIGLFIMIAWGLPELLSRWPRRKVALGLLMPVVLAALGICAYRQVGYWVDSRVLFSHAIEVTPDNVLAYNNRGNAYGNLARWREAIDDYNRAIAISPDYAEAYYNRGNAYSGLARWQEAIGDYSQAIRFKPDYADAYNNRGAAYGRLAHWREAMDDFSQAVKLDPDSAGARNNQSAAADMLAGGNKQ